MKEQVKISITELTKQVNDGMRKKQIAEFYGIPEFQVGKLLKQAGLKIKKIHALGFVLIDDKAVENVTVTETSKYVGAEEVLPYNEVVQKTWEGLEVFREFVQDTPQKLVTVEEFIQKQDEIQKDLEKEFDSLDSLEAKLELLNQ